MVKWLGYATIAGPGAMSNNLNWTYSRWLDEGSLVGVESWNCQHPTLGALVVCRDFVVDREYANLASKTYTVLRDFKKVGSYPVELQPEEARNAAIEELENGASD